MPERAWARLCRSGRSDVAGVRRPLHVWRHPTPADQARHGVLPVRAVVCATTAASQANVADWPAQGCLSCLGSFFFGTGLPLSPFVSVCLYVPHPGREVVRPPVIERFPPQRSKADPQFCLTMQRNVGSSKTSGKAFARLFISAFTVACLQGLGFTLQSWSLVCQVRHGKSGFSLPNLQQGRTRVAYLWAHQVFCWNRLCRKWIGMSRNVTLVAQLLHTEPIFCHKHLWEFSLEMFCNKYSVCCVFRYSFSRAITPARKQSAYLGGN